MLKITKREPDKEIYRFSDGNIDLGVVSNDSTDERWGAAYIRQKPIGGRYTIGKVLTSREKAFDWMQAHYDAELKQQRETK